MAYSEIFIWHAGAQHGPLSIPAVIGAIKVGKFSRDDPAWTRDDPEWRSLEKLIEEFKTSGDPASSLNSLLIPVLPENDSGPQYEGTPNSVKQRIGLALVAIACALVGLFWFVASQPASTNPDAIANPSQRDGNRKPSDVPKSLPLAESAHDAVKCVVMIRGAGGSGSGALVTLDGVSYLYTNAHVVCYGAFNAIDFRGRKVRVGNTVELPEGDGVDLARFLLIDPPAMTLAMAGRGEIEHGGAAFALGDSEGAGVIASLPGRVTGVGPDRIEVDCPFIQGNSGGPIVNSDGRVLALASYLTANHSIWAKGTRQEIRRFGWIPSGNHRWSKTTLAALDNERKNVEDCATTARLLAAVSFFEMGPDGFQFPESWPEEDQYAMAAILAESREHPLFQGILRTNETLSGLSEGSSPASNSTIFREYRRFFAYCSEYSESELAEARKRVQSGYWRGILHSRLPSHSQILEGFDEQVASFFRTGRLGSSLAEN